MSNFHSWIVPSWADPRIESSNIEKIALNIIAAKLFYHLTGFFGFLLLFMYSFNKERKALVIFFCQGRRERDEGEMNKKTLGEEENLYIKDDDDDNLRLAFGRLYNASFSLGLNNHIKRAPFLCFNLLVTTLQSQLSNNPKPGVLF